MKIRINFDKDKLFFTSDPHFHHSNIIEFCNRPWGDIKTHDLTLIENWNNIVPEDGIVFCGGDFIWTGNIDRVKDVVDRLNGKIYLTLGNHDYKNRLDREIFKSIFEDVQDIYYFTVKDEELEQEHADFMICHYPIMFWRSGYFQLHGHVHSGPKSEASEKVPFHPMRYDIGVDNNNYKPISYHELKVIFTKYSMK